MLKVNSFCFFKVLNLVNNTSFLTTKAMVMSKMLSSLIGKEILEIFWKLFSINYTC